jgi:phosphoribosylformylglycinamidine cyclo-ligase
VFTVLAELGGFPLTDVESAWNLGIGMFAVIEASSAARVTAARPSGAAPASAPARRGRYCATG